MANPLTTFIKAIFGKRSGNETSKEIEDARIKGEMAAKNAENRMGKMGFVDPVVINAEAARRAANAKTAVIKEGERIN